MPDPKRKRRIDLLSHVNGCSVKRMSIIGVDYRLEQSLDFAKREYSEY